MIRTTPILALAAALLTALLTALLAALISIPARAQTPDERARARELSQQGTALFKANNFAAALTRFREANRLVPHPVLDVNIGRCYEKLDDPAQALAHCKAALNSPNTPDPVREAARDCVERAEKTIGTRPHLVVTSRPPGASVLIDGLEVGRTPYRGEIDAGRRQIDLQLDAHRPTSRTLFAEFGGRYTVDEVLVSESVGALITLTSIPPGAAITLDGALIGQTPIQSYPLDVRRYNLEISQPGYIPQVIAIDLGDGQHLIRTFTLVPFEDPRTAIRPRWPGYTALGLGIATAATAGLFGYWALDARQRADTLARTSANPLDRPAYESYVSDMERHRFSSDLLWGTAGALIAGGLTWLIWPDDNR